MADHPRAQELGRLLFFDPKLSSSGEFSCATCHDPERGFADGQKLGRGSAQLERHTPSLFGVGYQRWFFWDGRADSLWSQALEPLEDLREMGSTRLEIVRYVSRASELRERYESLFGLLPTLPSAEEVPRARPPREQLPADPVAHQAWQQLDPKLRSAVTVAFVNIGKAIAAYERQIRAPQSSFDRFISGLGKRPQEDDPEAMAELSPAAQRGLLLFIGKAGCRTCHFGPHFTDHEFHDTRLPSNFASEASSAVDPEIVPALDQLEAGRYRGITLLRKNPFRAGTPYRDDYPANSGALLNRIVHDASSFRAFKTPSLRAVSRTAPYMHRGQLPTLRAVVEYYNTLESARPRGHHAESILQPLNLTPREVTDLTSFLQSL